MFFKCKWQVAIGDCIAFFDDNVFPHYLELDTRGKKCFIFSKGPTYQ